MLGKKKPGARSRYRIFEGDRPKTVGIEKIRARSGILVDRDDQRAAFARQVRALDIPRGLEHGHAFAGRQIAPDEESELAAVVGGVVELRPFVGKGLRLAGDGLSLFGKLDQLGLGAVIYIAQPEIGRAARMERVCQNV